MKQCPKCKSISIKRSHARGLIEDLLKSFNCKPFRCKDCGWRGILKDVSVSASSFKEKYSFIEISIGISVVIITVYMIIRLLNAD